MVRNSQGIWVNSQVFREPAIHFEKYGYYTEAPKGTIAWRNYWDEELRKCTEGYEVSGARITGDHYFYLNYFRIKKKQGDRKVYGFPDFWDGDYNYFHAVDIARFGISKEGLENLHLNWEPLWIDGGHHMMVAKARRKGFSYKNAAKAVNTYNTIRGSLTLFTAYEKKYLFPAGIMTMALNGLSFLSEHTAWGKKREYVDRQDHVRASYRIKENGVEYEKGYKSEMMALSFKDKPGAARGKDAYLVIMEEAGEWDGFMSSLKATEPSTRDGSTMTGQILAFGTGGDMSSASVDFADIFYNPELHNFLPFDNVWDEGASGNSCAFFFPVNLNNTDYMDEQGNSFLEEAREAEIEHRQKIIERSKGAVSMAKHLSEYALSPQEAFLVDNINAFPVDLLQRRLNQLMSDDTARIGRPYILRKEEGIVVGAPDLYGTLKPIIHYRAEELDQSGAVIVYEEPIPDPPPGMYVIGYDPYRHNTSQTDSLGAAFVYKNPTNLSTDSDYIVAEYVGRPRTTDEYERRLVLLAEYYNATILYENEVNNTEKNFQYWNKLHLLNRQPDSLIKAHVKKSKVKREYGMHMTSSFIEAGDKYITNWLLTEREKTKDGEPIYNLDLLYSIGLIEEMIKYNPKGNFDRLMAFRLVMFAREEEKLSSKASQGRERKVIKQLLEMKKYTR